MRKVVEGLRFGSQSLRRSVPAIAWEPNQPLRLVGSRPAPAAASDQRRG